MAQKSEMPHEGATIKKASLEETVGAMKYENLVVLMGHTRRLIRDTEFRKQPTEGVYGSQRRSRRTEVVFNVIGTQGKGVKVAYGVSGGRSTIDVLDHRKMALFLFDNYHIHSFMAYLDDRTQWVGLNRRGGAELYVLGAEFRVYLTTRKSPGVKKSDIDCNPLFVALRGFSEIPGVSF